MLTYVNVYEDGRRSAIEWLTREEADHAAIKTMTKRDLARTYVIERDSEANEERWIPIKESL